MPNTSGSATNPERILVKLHRGYRIPPDRDSKLSTKLQQQYAGPYRVLEYVGGLAYKINLPPTYRVHPVLSVAHLTP